MTHFKQEKGPLSPSILRMLDAGTWTSSMKIEPAARDGEH
jgi:hypothetical protein